MSSKSGRSVKDVMNWPQLPISIELFWVDGIGAVSLNLEGKAPILYG
jgi:hypothetical protein